MRIAKIQHLLALCKAFVQLVLKVVVILLCGLGSKIASYINLIIICNFVLLLVLRLLHFDMLRVFPVWSFSLELKDILFFLKHVIQMLHSQWLFAI